MTKRMLIDATHAEETRVVVLDGNRLEDFDVETAAKKQLKGNIYLAKVVRVEPSLQAAFVEYGGGRHGFLAFGEIHPDYYQIPVADRQRLLELQEAEARAEEEADDAAAAADEAAELGAAPPHSGAPLGIHDESAIPGHSGAEHALSEAADPAYGDQDAVTAAIEADLPHPDAPESDPAPETGDFGADLAPEAAEPALALDPQAESTAGTVPADATPELVQDIADEAVADTAGEDAQAAAIDYGVAESGAEAAGQVTDEGSAEPRHEDHASPDDSNGHREEEPREARAPARFMRSYKIQEVIRRRQILLIQVVKEERGSKGAALTTYISLAGRFSVLMPNSPRGGGISRKITSTADRRRLKEVTSELQIPRGMGLIVRTAGANRPKAEIKRDCEYLLELWDSIRETTMRSIAPALIHEEANLIKRAIRDNYSRDVDEVLVDGEAGWRAARDFMRMLMPAHARKVVLWSDPQPLFARQAVEAQLDAMLVPTVQLKSGGYLVINQTEALVAIDVNSGRSTRERGIEETALKTNLEAADEVARQLRLRDLAGLIVIDFIDMESRRNNAAVEKRMKDALKDDRARIQLGSISSFGLMEMSRQRLRPSLAETSFTPCPHCGGTGHVRSTETSALAVLRAIEDEGAKRRAAEICVHVAGAIALYVLNHKRVRIAEIEARYGMTVSFAADESLLPPETRIDRLRPQVAGDLPEPVATPIPISTRPPDPIDDDVEEEDDEVSEAVEAVPETAGGAEPAADGEPRKRRRRRRGGRREDGLADSAPDAAATVELPLQAPDAAPDPALAEQPDLPLPPQGEAEIGGLDAAAAEEARGRRRGRRGGRRRRRDEPGGVQGEASGEAAEEGSSPEAPASFDAPVRAPYSGPTPADPFGGGVFDIYDVMEQAEARAAAPHSPPPPPIAAPPRPEAEAASAEATVPLDTPVPDAEPAPVPDAEAAAEEVPVLHAEPQPPLPQPEAVVPEPSVEDAEPAPAAPETLEHPGETAQVVPLEYAAEELLPEPAEARSASETMVAADRRPEPVAGPISAPVIIGSDESGAEKRRGWWRR